MPAQEWYIINNIDAIDSPALAVYPERIVQNIRQTIRMAGGTQRLRPHIKTHKLAEVCRLLLAEGITRFKCATIAEAELLALVHAPDALLAYQPVGPKIQRLLQLVQQYPGTAFSCLVDDVTQATALSAAFASAGQSIGVYLDLNIGMNRTGIPPGPEAWQLYLYCHSLNGLRVNGLHAYDGHIHDSDSAVRKEKTQQAFEPVSALALAIEQASGQYPAIVAGGSPTFPIHASNPDVECSPGTFVFWDWGYRHGLPEQQYHYAAVLLTRVVSVIDAQHLCLDLGHKSVAAEKPLPRVHFLDYPTALPVSQSEEHLVVKVADSSVHPIGGIWYGIPVHICPTVALYNTVQVVEGQQAVAQWKVMARDRFIQV